MIKNWDEEIEKDLRVILERTFNVKEERYQGFDGEVLLHSL